MSEHTQGGWCAGGAHPDGTWVYTETGGNVAWVPAGLSSNSAASVSAEEAHRRALLIAAAPELLFALVDAVSALFMRIEERHGARVASEYPEVVSGRAVIAKAKWIKT